MERADEVVKTEALHHRVIGGMRRVGGFVLDQLYPPVCLGCEAPIAASDGLCGACFGKLRPITAPLCRVLGLPFEVSLGLDALSAEAIAEPPPFGRARAAVIYNEVARTIVSRLKYGDRPELARFCARLMAGAGHELWGSDALLVLVPLHPSRQRERRYNQSGELAAAIGKLTGVAVDLHLVRRVKRTRQQVGLSSDGRARNVAGAFSVHPDLLARLRGRRVVLVDDVYTTGSTVKAVTRTLLKGGASEVDVISFARVVIGAEMPI
ncbi:ComF family protein [Devosia sp. UYZn731]|uniref:ComF family protein n=1 Tax=Devosia sp. UYZn731 TaxID=3156345 RepID=UPI003391F53D